LRPRNGVQGSGCKATILSRRCPLWVKSRHQGATRSCPLYPQKRTWITAVVMSALCQKRTHAVQHKTDKRSPRRCVGSPYPRSTTRCPPIGMERCLGLRRYSSGIHVIGDYVMDSNNRIGRRERFEILKIVQGLGEGVVAVDKGQLRPLRPKLAALEES